MINTAEGKSINRIKEMAFCHRQRQEILLRTKQFSTNLVDNNESILENLSIYIACNKNKLVGLNFEDAKQVYMALQNAKFNDNKHKTEFPDFILDNGFIEHFKVTSSKENSKGSAKQILEAEKNRMIKPEKELFLEEFEKTADSNPMQYKKWIYKDVKHSYENFVKSFKKQFEKHFNCIDKYQGDKNLKIFLIEYADNGLEMAEQTYENDCDVEKQISNEEQHLWFYQLSKDKNMLEYLLNYADKLDYVIFDIEHDFEIIKLNKIKEIISKTNPNYLVVGKINQVQQSLICRRVNF